MCFFKNFELKMCCLDWLWRVTTLRVLLKQFTIFGRFFLFHVCIIYASGVKCFPYLNELFRICRWLSVGLCTYSFVLSEGNFKAQVILPLQIGK